MSDDLPQDAVDQLVSDTLIGKAAGGRFLPPPKDQRKIKIYDFKRPDKFSRDQIRIVSIMHETFAPPPRPFHPSCGT
jgi:flagellar motor switch protein FliM